MSDFTEGIRSPWDRALISELEDEVSRLTAELESANTEVQVWKGRYENAEMKLDRIRGYTG